MLNHIGKLFTIICWSQIPLARGHYEMVRTTTVLRLVVLWATNKSLTHTIFAGMRTTIIWSGLLNFST